VQSCSASHIFDLDRRRRPPHPLCLQRENRELEKEAQRGSGGAGERRRRAVHGSEARDGKETRLEDEMGLVPTTRIKKQEQATAEERKSRSSTSKPMPHRSLFTAEEKERPGAAPSQATHAVTTNWAPRTLGPASATETQ
jgi:hypothetical protein